MTWATQKKRTEKYQFYQILVTFIGETVVIPICGTLKLSQAYNWLQEIMTKVLIGSLLSILMKIPQRAVL